MDAEALERKWRRLSEEVITGMKEWRQAHPKATLREIEAALDERLLGMSYFSRLADADTFSRLALVETQWRGVESARRVAAVSDGAEWEQGFIDMHRPDAVRILDLPDAVERPGPRSRLSGTSN